MDDGSVQPTMTGKIVFGCAAESVRCGLLGRVAGGDPLAGLLSATQAERRCRRQPIGLALSRLRVKTPKHTISPLSVDEVARFWSSFRTSRDLAIVGLMLLQGLRSQEVLDLNRDDLLLPEAQICVRGKGNKTRFLPLAPEAAQLLDHYLRLERPTTSTNALFVSLKGPARGTRMTPAGLRSLFRHHRRTTGVKIANPHRFRHTFASDMVRAGVSLPALMQLMGHAQIQTTLAYMQVTPLEVYQQYARAVAQLIRPVPVTPA
jgi:integrase